ncbi:hypothetical protein Nepgr_001905 [Nepenthes gracilis]|uniref:Uncharacterized protein n=1 Tax=Nepenthes gracilis TaxID=150966 RepID=A0AAD3RXU9_NEPGR|nr:hypothetical protein Nepgr_001905 [Nepenthes gracilis]
MSRWEAYWLPVLARREASWGPLFEVPLDHAKKAISSVSVATEQLHEGTASLASLMNVEHAKEKGKPMPLKEWKPSMNLSKEEIVPS